MINPFSLLLLVIFRRLIKIIFAPFIFIAIYLVMSKVIEPLILDFTRKMGELFPSLQGLHSVVSEVIYYLDLLHMVNIIVATVSVVMAIKMFSLALRAFGLGGNN